MEGPQGSVGMYVSDSAAGQLQGKRLYSFYSIKCIYVLYAHLTLSVLCFY